jgi:hypothetical protein
MPPKKKVIVHKHSESESESENESPRYNNVNRQTKVKSLPKVQTKMTIDKCDACDKMSHLTENCPNFKGKKREKHKDAEPLTEEKLSEMLSCIDKKAEERELVLPETMKFKKSKADGSCLFHSLAYSQTRYSDEGHALREEISEYMLKNPKFLIAGKSLSQWISETEKGMTLEKYAKKVANPKGIWGGAIEMVIFANMENCDVKQWAKVKCKSDLSDGKVCYHYVRQAYFRPEAKSKKDKRQIINVVLNLKENHYDVLLERKNKD